MVTVLAWLEAIPRFLIRRGVRTVLCSDRDRATVPGINGIYNVQCTMYNVAHWVMIFPLTGGPPMLYPLK